MKTPDKNTGEISSGEAPKIVTKEDMLSIGPASPDHKKDAHTYASVPSGRSPYSYGRSTFSLSQSYADERITEDLEMEKEPGAGKVVARITARTGESPVEGDNVAAMDHISLDDMKDPDTDTTIPIEDRGQQDLAAQEYKSGLPTGGNQGDEERTGDTRVYIYISILCFLFGAVFAFVVFAISEMIIR